MNNKSGLRKSMYISFIIICIIVVTAMSIIGFISYSSAKQQLTDLGIKSLQNKVNIGIETMKSFEKEVQKGKYTRQEAQEMFRQIFLNPKSQDGKSREVKSSLDLEEVKAYMYAIDSTGLEVMHPAKEGDNIMDYKDASGAYVAKEIIKEGSNPTNNGVIQFVWKNPGETEAKSKVNVVKYYKDWDWYVNVGCYEEDFYKGANKLLIEIIALIIVFSALVSICLIYIVGKKIFPLEGIIVNMKELANGDLRIRSDYNKKDEIGYVSSVFNEMTVQMETLISKIKTALNTLNESSTELAASSSDINHSSKDIEEVMSEIASGSTDQSSKLVDVLKLVEGLASNLDSIGQKFSNMAVSGREIKYSADTNSENLQELLSSIEDIKNLFSDVINKINEFEGNMERINLIVDVIDGVVQQTNLLALNASIEAARAGEAGRGFAVVADEIRKLAQQSLESSNNIIGITNNMTKDFNNVTTTANSATSKLESQVGIIRNSITSFEAILKEINEMMPAMEEVNNEIQSALGKKEMVLEKTESVSSISEELSASTEEVVATIEEQNKIVNNLAYMAEDLNKISEDIHSNIERFKTS
ncbi:methyl-accepting chemotaxis protein [Clostridium peptidivorans]|uniref:methyl-accepting chemotaxis protein n=1 Tax=Clostridium peptidivorans TaxID=100174 RepID=UPI0015CA6CFD|nr:cache domain-containing protein [Clostridium peptidivorans]